MPENVEFHPRDFARSFLKSLTPKQKDKFKMMLEHGHKSGQSIADLYHVDYDQFISVIKEDLNIS